MAGGQTIAVPTRLIRRGAVHDIIIIHSFIRPALTYPYFLQHDVYRVDSWKVCMTIELFAFVNH
jgi:hypothetical protein